MSFDRSSLERERGSEIFSVAHPVKALPSLPAPTLFIDWQFGMQLTKKTAHSATFLVHHARIDKFGTISKWGGECFIEDQTFLAVVRFSSSPTPSPSRSSVSKLDGRYTGRLRKRDNLLTGEGGEPNHRTARNPGPL